MNLVPRVKIWLEDANGAYIIGKGTATLLEMIDAKGTLMAAARECGMSYNYAWRLVKRIENALGCAIVERHRGGPKGGYATLTSTGRALLATYNTLVATVNNAKDSVECDIDV